MFVAICTAVLLAIAGLVLDGGGKLRATERAYALVLEAARAGGQALDPADAVTGAAIRVDPTAAQAAATEYLRQAGVHGSVTVSPDRDELTVVVDTTYATRFLSVIGIGSMDVTGHGTATLLHGVDQPEGTKGCGTSTGAPSLVLASQLREIPFRAKASTRPATRASRPSCWLWTEITLARSTPAARA
ncbi:hypothetical protein ACH5AL_28005 [Actinacidiphila glaucinigra]|uniref:hypothetical protein n=1 Tax=Actinacidiphila glaucinigra TaxID=235986 RepID=UPI0037B939D3